jgi:beta-mannosidase
MGALYWQVNDCWPVASWSGLDYFGRWKAMHYYARRFFKDLLVSPHQEDGQVKFHVVSDRTTPTPAELRILVLDFGGGPPLYEKTLPLDVAPLASRVYHSVSTEDLLRGRDPAKVFLHATLSAGKQFASSNNLFFKPFKELSLPAAKITTRVTRQRGTTVIRLETDYLARAVYLSAEGLEVPFPENFFDMLPGHIVEMHITGHRLPAPAEIQRRLRVRTLADAFAGR